MVQRPALDFGSGHDLMVCESEPCIRLCADSTKPAWDSLSAPPWLMRTRVPSLSLSKINKHLKNKNKNLNQVMLPPPGTLQHPDPSPGEEAPPSDLTHPVSPPPCSNHWPQPPPSSTAPGPLLLMKAAHLPPLCLEHSAACSHGCPFPRSWLRCPSSGRPLRAPGDAVCPHQPAQPLSIHEPRGCHLSLPRRAGSVPDSSTSWPRHQDGAWGPTDAREVFMR